MRIFNITFATIALALLASSCNKSESVSSDWGYGSVDFSCTTLSSVGEDSRSEEEESRYIIPESLIPSTEDIIVLISGSYIDPDSSDECSYSYGPLTLGEYSNSLPMMVASSDYNAKFYIGEQGKEGEEATYFSGSTPFEVVARAEMTQSVVISLQNSIIALEATDIFSAYYLNASFTVETSAGNSFSFEIPNEKIVFVEAGTTLSLSGVATKSSGESVTFNKSVIGNTTSQTMSRIKISAESIGGENINITLDDTITEVEATTIELNQQ